MPTNARAWRTASPRIGWPRSDASSAMYAQISARSRPALSVIWSERLIVVSPLRNLSHIEGLDAPSSDVGQALIDICFQRSQLIEHELAPQPPFAQSFAHNLARRGIFPVHGLLEAAISAGMVTVKRSRGVLMVTPDAASKIILFHTARTKSTPPRNGIALYVPLVMRPDTDSRSTPGFRLDRSLALVGREINDAVRDIDADPHRALGQLRQRAALFRTAG